MLIRRFFAFVVSLFILFSLPLNAANAASGWKVDSAKSSGSRVILGATNGGYKSAINIPPNLAKIAKFGMKGANAVGLIQIASGLLGNGVDFVLDPANNRVNYRTFIPTDGYIWTLDGIEYGSKNEVCNAANLKYPSRNVTACGTSPLSDTTGHLVLFLDGNETKGTGFSYGWSWRTDGSYRKADSLVANKSISISDLAPQVVSDANGSNPARKAAAQKILQDVAKAAVIAGDYDADLLAGAVPISDNTPVIPAVPGSQTGDVEGGMTGGDVGAQADKAREDADAARKAAQAAKDAAATAAEEARRLNDEAKDLINTAIDQAIKDAAATAAADAAKSAADAQSVADAAAEKAATAAEKAAAAADARVAAAEKAAAAAAKSAADVAADASASAADKADAAARADAAEKAAADARAAAEKAATDAADAAKARPKEKPFELPPFCSWAAPVCDFIDWFKGDVPADLPAGEVPFATTGDIGLDNVDRFEKRIDFSGQCPANDFSFTMMGVTYAKPIPYYHLCGFLEQIAPWLLAMTYLGVAYFVVENI